MFCRKCGAQLHDYSKFCPKCGTNVLSANDFSITDLPYYSAMQSTLSETDNKNTDSMLGFPNKPNKKKKIIIIAAVCTALLAVILAVLIPILIENAKEDRYETATEMMDSDPLSAKAAFLALDDYSNSAERAEECQQIYDYNAAVALMASGDMQGARDGFLALGDYSDSVIQANECQKSLDYAAAIALMDSGDMQGARDIFLDLGEYFDSVQLAEQCKLSLDYDSAIYLMNKGFFAEAYDAFTTLKDYKDSAILAADCRQIRDYGQAGEYFSDGKYYSAYLLYTGLGDYLDSAELAAACAQPMPKTGEMYRGEDYKGMSLYKGVGYDIFSFSAPKDGYYTYVKISSSSIISNLELPIVTAFLAPGKKIKIKVPAGSFVTISVAYGTVWYGKEDLFGDNGTYVKMKFKNDDGTSSSSIIYTDITEYYGEYYLYKFKLREEGYSDGQTISRGSF